jgi:hypothetical protein
MTCCPRPDHPPAMRDCDDQTLLWRRSFCVLPRELVSVRCLGRFYQLKAELPTPELQQRNSGHYRVDCVSKAQAASAQPALRKKRRQRRGHQEIPDVLNPKPLPRQIQRLQREDVLRLPFCAQRWSSRAIPIYEWIVRKSLDREDASARCHYSVELWKCTCQVEMMQHA